MGSDNSPIDASSPTPPPQAVESVKEEDFPAVESVKEEDLPAKNPPPPNSPSNSGLVQRLSELSIFNAVENSPDTNSIPPVMKPDAVKKEQLDSDAHTNLSLPAVPGLDLSPRKDIHFWDMPNSLIHGGSPRTPLWLNDWAINVPPPIFTPGLVQQALNLSSLKSIENSREIKSLLPVMPPPAPPIFNNGLVQQATVKSIERSQEIKSLLSMMKSHVRQQEQSNSDALRNFTAVSGLNFGKRKEIEIEGNESNKKSKSAQIELSIRGGLQKPTSGLLRARRLAALAMREKLNPSVKLFQERFNARMKQQLQEQVPGGNKILPVSLKVIPVSMKLFIDTRSNTVVYAEAGKNFVEWLFEILSLPMPVATFVGLSVTGQMNGSLGNLHTSIQNLINSRHILTKDASFYQPLDPASMHKYCTCTLGHYNLVASREFCPNCRMNVISTMRYVGSPAVKEGSYMVTDDLMVKPMFSGDIANVFDRLSLNEEGALEERLVESVIGKDKGAKLIHAAFYSKKVLTDVFILELASLKPFGFSPSPNGEGI